MRQLHTSACVVLLSILVSLAPASAFGLKKAKPPATPATTNKSASQATSDTKDVIPSIDEVLKQPVKPQPLQGNVEATDAAASPDGTPLKGNADTNGSTRLNGNADEQGAPRLIPMQPKADTTILKGNASILDGKVAEDPDLQDRELMVEWDRWRNKFLRAVQLQVQAGVNHPDDWEEDARPKLVIDPYTGQPVGVQPRFPMGTEAWFTCQITADKRVKNLSIVKPSGYPAYDKAVLEGVRALEGTSMLIYPSGSKRQVVGQTAGIRTAGSSDYQYHHFGDVEHVRGQ
jgi:hypothetical protein